MAGNVFFHKMREISFDDACTIIDINTTEIRSDTLRARDIELVVEEGLPVVEETFVLGKERRPSNFETDTAAPMLIGMASKEKGEERELTSAATPACHPIRPKKRTSLMHGESRAAMILARPVLSSLLMIAFPALMAFWLTTTIRFVLTFFFNTPYKSSRNFDASVSFAFLLVVVFVTIAAVLGLSGISQYPCGVFRSPLWFFRGAFSDSWRFHRPLNLTGSDWLSFACWGPGILNNYHKLIAIAAVIWQGDVVFVRADYLIKLAGSEGIIPKRQSLPKNVVIGSPSSGCVKFCKEVMVERPFLGTGAFLVALLNTMWILFNAVEPIVLKDTTTYVRIITAILNLLLMPLFAYWCFVVVPFYVFISGWSFVSISYMWMSEEHPDPTGEQLRFVSQCLQAYKRSRSDRVAVFWDYLSLYQHPRSESEKRSFKRCLKQGVLNLCYGSVWTQVWMLTCPLWWHSRQYERSGWCCTERCISSIIKPRNQVLDLGILQHEILMLELTKSLSKHHVLSGESQNTRKAILKLVASFVGIQYGMDRAVCSTLKDVTWRDVVRKCTSVRGVPQSPSTFYEMIAKCEFTNGADAEVVKDIYAKTFKQCVGEVAHLNFANLGWTDDHVVRLADALKHAKKLRILSLDNNSEITDEGLASLCPSIQNVWVLSLAGTGISDAAKIWNACPNLKCMRRPSVLGVEDELDLIARKDSELRPSGKSWGSKHIGHLLKSVWTDRTDPA